MRKKDRKTYRPSPPKKKKSKTDTQTHQKVEERDLATGRTSSIQQHGIISHKDLIKDETMAWVPGQCGRRESERVPSQTAVIIYVLIRIMRLIKIGEQEREGGEGGEDEGGSRGGGDKV